MQRLYHILQQTRLPQIVRNIQRQPYFSERDVEFNVKGTLSRRQRWRYTLARLAEHLLGGLMVYFWFAVLVSSFDISVSLDMILAVLGLTVAITLILFAIRVRAAFENRVKVAQGRLSKRIVLDSGWPLFVAAIGEMLFFIPSSLYEAVEDNAVYKGHYLERPKQIGGSVLLSVEFVEAAPPEEEYED